MKLKRMLSLVMVLALLSGLLTTLPVFAATTVVASGDCGGEGDGSNLKWTLDSNGTLTISGTGKMKSFVAIEYTPWYSNRSSIKEIVIKGGVSSIGYGAFGKCTSLTNITIPDTVLSIGGDAFADCESLTNVTVGDGITIISRGLFRNCVN